MAPPRIAEGVHGRSLFGLWLFLPAFLMTLLFSVAPVGYAVFTSFFKAPYMRREAFVGFENFVNFLMDPVGRASIVHSVVFVLGSLAVVMPLGIVLALAMNRSFRGRGVVQILLISPWVVSLVVVALLWNWLLDAQYGFITYLFSLVGAQLDLLSSSDGAMLALVVANVWQSYPYAFILILATLQTIPAELYEAAALDGAGWLARFLHITLPGISNTLMIVIIVLGMHYFNLVTLPLIMTDGGPFGATNVISLELYHSAFTAFNTGYASAIAVYMFIFNALFAAVYFLARGKKGSD